jgi:hypothetical protein
MPNTQQPDLFWAAIDWAVRGAGALLLMVFAFGWKDYREQMKRLIELEKSVAVLVSEVTNLKKDRGRE